MTNGAKPSVTGGVVFVFHLRIDVKKCVVTVPGLVGGLLGGETPRFQSEPLALVGKVYARLVSRLPSQRSPREAKARAPVTQPAGAWCLGCPRNAARAARVYRHTNANLWGRRC